jgi:hypothetical protein
MPSSPPIAIPSIRSSSVQASRCSSPETPSNLSRSSYPKVLHTPSRWERLKTFVSNLQSKDVTGGLKQL